MIYCGFLLSESFFSRAYSKPAGYGNLPEIKIISKTAVVSADGFVTIEPDDGDVDSDYDGELTRYNGDAKKYEFPMSLTPLNLMRLLKTKQLRM